MDLDSKINIFGREFAARTLIIIVIVIAAVIIIIIAYVMEKKKAAEHFQNHIIGYWSAPLSFSTRANLKMLSLFIGEKDESGRNKSYLLMIDDTGLPVFNGFVDIEFLNEDSSADDHKKYMIKFSSKEELPEGWENDLFLEYYDLSSKIRIWHEDKSAEGKKEILAILYKDGEVSEIFNGQ